MPDLVHQLQIIFKIEHNFVAELRSRMFFSDSCANDICFESIERYVIVSCPPTIQPSFVVVDAIGTVRRPVAEKFIGYFFNTQIGVRFGDSSLENIFLRGESMAGTHASIIIQRSQNNTLWKLKYPAMGHIRSASVSA